MFTGAEPSPTSNRGGTRLDTAEDVEAGLSLAQQGGYQVLIVDWGLPSKTGIDVMRNLRAQGIDVPILMLTARGDIAEKSGHSAPASMTTSRNPLRSLNSARHRRPFRKIPQFARKPSTSSKNRGASSIQVKCPLLAYSRSSELGIAACNR